MESRSGSVRLSIEVARVVEGWWTTRPTKGSRATLTSWSVQDLAEAFQKEVKEEPRQNLQEHKEITFFWGAMMGHVFATVLLWFYMKFQR